MDDPFSALKEALETVFQSVPTRNEKLVYFEIQQLKEAIDNYDPNRPRSFFELIKAIGDALPQLVKWRIDFDPIKNAADSLAQMHIRADVDWDMLFSRKKLRFQEEYDNELIPWINAASEVAFGEQKPSEQTRLLIEYSEELGFSQKIGTQLKKDPEFLSQLILESENNFIKIANSRLILYLTDEQIATAIMQYIPKLNQEQISSLMQVEQLIDKLNGVLSNGRSVSTLLRNVEAKSILDRSELFQIYQSDKYKNREEQPSFSPEIEGQKLGL